MILMNGGNFIAKRILNQGIQLSNNELRDINGNWNSGWTVDASFELREYRATGSTAGNSGVRLICGSGTSDISVNDYQLGNAYDDTEFTSTGSINASNGVFTITATFLNVSGVAKTITEIGVLWFWRYSSTSTAYYLLARMKVPERVVENGATATFTYEMDFANV